METNESFIHVENSEDDPVEETIDDVRIRIHGICFGKECAIQCGKPFSCEGCLDDRCVLFHV